MWQDPKTLKHYRFQPLSLMLVADSKTGNHNFLLKNIQSMLTASCPLFFPSRLVSLLRLSIFELQSIISVTASSCTMVSVLFTCSPLRFHFGWHYTPNLNNILQCVWYSIIFSLVLYACLRLERRMSLKLLLFCRMQPSFKICLIAV